MSDSSIWVFSNSQNKSQKITVMGLPSARAFCTVLRKDELVFWMVRQDDGAEQFVMKISALFSTEEAKAPETPSAIRIIREIEKANQGEGRERRKHKRIDVRLNVMVIYEKDIFQVCTKDISEGGVMLENPVPNRFLGNICRCVVSSSDNTLSVSFDAKILEASARGSRIMFEKMDEANLEKLRKWIDANDPEAKAAAAAQAAQIDTSGDIRIKVE